MTDIKYNLNNIHNNEKHIEALRWNTVKHMVFFIKI